MYLPKIITFSIFIVFISSGVAKSNNCISNDGSLFLSNHSIIFKSAHHACKKSHGTLAQISNENFLSATDLVFQCLGPNRDAWINSWNTNINYDECLTLYVGNTTPGGSVAKKCSGKRYALCNTVKHVTANNDTESSISSIDSVSVSLQEEEDGSTDFPLESSVVSEEIADDGDNGDDDDALADTDDQDLIEDMQALPAVWKPGDDTGMMNLDSAGEHNNIEYLWGVGGDFMFNSPNNNGDTSSKTASVDNEDDQGDETEIEMEGMAENDEEEKEKYSQFVDQEVPPPENKSIQQDNFWNSAISLADTDLNVSDDDIV